jgi:GntR family transcriptional regulator
VRQIAEHLAVNPMTVSRAIQQLVDQGWLERRRGQATKVALRTETMASGISLLEPQIYALLSQAKQLGVSLPELLQRLNERWQD